MHKRIENSLFPGTAAIRVSHDRSDNVDELCTYINIVGGLRVDEPAIDLSIAMALISSLKDTPIDENAVVFGEPLSFHL